MSQTGITCTVCGGTDFTLDAGSFFCSECNTQSQDVREEVYNEYFGIQKGTSRVLPKKSSTNTQIPGQKVQLTSWEILNYVLKGITDELIKFGAKPNLKIVTLQLWAFYLRKLEIAFTSVEVEHKPKLGYAFKRSDASIIYGLTEKDLREKSWQSRSKSSSAVSSISYSIDSETAVSATDTNLTRRAMLRKLTIRKKALATAEYTKLSQETTKSLTQTLEELDSSDTETETPKRMKITKTAKSLLNSSYSSSTDGEQSIHRRITKHEIQSVRNVTTAKVVAIVNVALALTQQDIQVSDFIRWVEEGHISLGTSRKFLPEGTKLNSHAQRMIQLEHLSYVKCQQLMANMCRVLEISKLPPPDLSALAQRYCLELQLPGELTDLAKRLLNLMITCDVSSHKTSVCQNSEVMVMSAIIVVMKLLFNLDDCTEYRLSHTATEINRACMDDINSKPLFVWSDWMHFIECRKAVVSGYHLPTRVSVYGETMGKDTELFLQHYEHTAGHLPNMRETNKRYALKKDWVEALSRCLRMLVDDQPPNKAYIKFSPSLTPLHSCTQVLLSQHSELVAPVKAILSQDYTSHSVDHILNPDRTIALGLMYDLNITRQRGAAILFHDQQCNITPKKEFPVIPKYKLNQVNFTLNIVNRVKNHGKQKIQSQHTANIQSEQSHGANSKEGLADLSEIVSYSDEEENDAESGFCEASTNQEIPTCHTNLELFHTGSQYWLCHTDIVKKCFSSNEFEMFAMKMMPSSFLWVLRECSRTIHVPLKELYAGVVAIEANHKKLVREGFQLHRGKSKHENK